MNPTTDSTLADPQQIIADLQRANADLQQRLHEAQAREAATAEVLQVINSSPGNLGPVFEAMLDRAMQLCDAAFGTLWTYDGEYFHQAASKGVPAALAKLWREPWRPPPGGSGDRIVHGEPYIHIVDAAADSASSRERTARRALIDLGGGRSYLAVPLWKDGVLLGGFSVYRREVRPFNDKQIALLQNFAAQAIIAMENARLITETRDALDQQTATAEVLGIINASPGNLAPVFDAMIEKARALCDAPYGNMMIREGERFRAIAVHSPPLFAELVRRGFEPHPNSPLGRLRRGERFIHIPDLAEAAQLVRDDPVPRAAVELGRVRTVLMVPLIKDGSWLGVFTLWRPEVRPFSDRQVAVVQNFAAQAVIAVENARLITETREALDQQTATADVLRVISRSTFDLQPVLDTMVETAARLCRAEFGHVALRDGDLYRPYATFAFSPEFKRFVQGLTFRPSRQTLVGRVLLESQIVQLEDVNTDPEYALPQVASVGDVRSQLGVPFGPIGEPTGVFVLARREPGLFTEKQIELVRTFADQALIAIENTRLITETQEALDQQTATAEVLGVINSSPGDLAPVFDAMLAKAMQLCGASYGSLTVYDGEYFRCAARYGLPDALFELLSRPRRAAPGSAQERLLCGEPLVHISDYRTLLSPDQVAQAAVELGEVRTILFVPLRKDDKLLGYLTANRREERPFTEKQIALLQNFAAQAVIAMENARLLGEIRQRQAELRVTFDNMGDGVVMFDAGHRLAAWNRNFQELLDLPDAVLSKRPRYFDYLRVLAERDEFGPDDVEAGLSRRLNDTGQELRLERERSDGRVIEVRRNAVPDGGFVLIYSDITERKRSEAEIRAARDAAEAAYADLKAAQANLIQAEKMASLGQLTAGIAHEIKNPLNFVNNFASLSNELLEELKDEAKPALSSLDHDKRVEIDETIEMLSRNLEKIAEHGRRADNIVKSMLEHSRGVGGERREVDLNALVEEALNLSYHGARAHDATFNISLGRDYAQSLKPIELAPQEMTRVFLNLFGNGFYAANKRAKANSDAGYRPILSVATREDDDTVEVRVRDNGTGIPAEIRDKLFQPFFTTKPTGEGTGLGLSISYDIVTQQHGGTITVESEPGSFTEFTVRLPRH